MRRRQQPPEPPVYRGHLLRLLHRYVQDAYPADAVGWEEFSETAQRYLGDGETRRAAVYFSDLWKLFRPDFRDHLDAYYDSLALINTMRFLDYSSDEKTISDHYAGPYAYAHERLGDLHVLEVGGGIPHGLIRLHLAQPGSVKSVTINEIDAPYARFALWFCRQEGIDADLIPAQAGFASALPRRRYNFVFAKDVLEHLHNPESAVRAIADSARDDALLALDIQNKGARVYQHVFPRLSPLRRVLIELGWKRVEKLGSLSLFARPS